MLVLARQKDQSIVIGDDVVITIVDIRGDKVRLGINAPREVTVHRKEIYDLVSEKAKQPVPPPDEATLAYMRAAIEQAQVGLGEGGLPIGSVLVRGGQIVGRGHNRRVQQSNPMAHAEIDCLTNAGRQETYKDTTLYSTLMPCHLCSGAVVQFGIPRVIVGESVNFAGAPDFLRKHGVEVIDLHDVQCISMMGDFIKANPKLWNEDIGK
jgi:creatinine deaminase